MVWHEVTRDVLIIVSALALLVTLAFTALVAWQLYRFAMEFHEEVQPVIVALQDTAETVRDTADFVGTRVITPSADAVGGAAEASGIFTLLRRFYTRV